MKPTTPVPSIVILVCLLLCRAPAAIDSVTEDSYIGQQINQLPEGSVTADAEDPVPDSLLESLRNMAGNETPPLMHKQSMVVGTKSAHPAEESQEGEEDMAREEEEEEVEEHIRHSKSIEQQQKKQGIFITSMDQALNFIRSKFQSEEQKSGSLNSDLDKSTKESTFLKSALLNRTKDWETKEQQFKQELREVLASKSVEDGQLKSLERHLLYNEQALHQVNRSYLLRGKALELTHRRLSDFARKDVELKRHLDNATSSNIKLSRKLLEARLMEHSLKTEEATKDAQLTIAKATISKVLVDLNSLKAAKSHEDSEMRQLGREAQELRQEKANEDAKLNEFQSEASKMKEELRGARAQESQDEKQLQSLSKRLANQEQRNQHLEQAAALRERVLHDSISSLKAELGSDSNREQEMVKDWKVERAQLSEQANRSSSNASALEEQLEEEQAVTQNLKKQVLMLKKRVQEGDQARQHAQNLLRESSANAAKAVSEAKQLQGSIPWLRSKLAADEEAVRKAKNDEQLAHEARDAAKAMLSDARRDIVRLQAQNAAALQALSKAVAQENPNAAGDLLKDATATLGQLDGIGSLTMGNLTDASIPGSSAVPPGNATADLEDNTNMDNAAAMSATDLPADIPTDVPPEED